jgi:REP element-mobilizing transposase RayT
MEKLIANQSYHIFNHANGFENVFNERENYRYFLEKYKEYIDPIAETYSYCLMPNHFHLVVRMRKREVIEEIISRNNFSKVEKNFGKVVSNEVIERYLSKQFSNLFSSYTQSYNKYLKRRGSVFIKNFKRDAIKDKEHFLNEIMYTHRNPIHHGFRTEYNDWEFCSYYDIVNGKSELVEVDKLLKVFEGKDHFIALHSEYLEDWKCKFI